MKKSKSKLSVFDFDGTIIVGDSIKLFSKWLSKNKLDYILIYHIYLRIICIIYKSKDLKHERATFYISRMIKKNKNINEFHKILESKLFSDSIDLINNERNNFKVVIVSASFEQIVQKFCINFLKVDVITNSVATYLPENDINFENKILCLKQKYGENIQIQSAYGNSIGDKSMLEHSINPYWRFSNGKIIKWR